MLISKFAGSNKFNVKGQIKTGCKCIKASCSACNKEITAIKPYDTFICPKCGSQVPPKSGAKEFMTALPYFVLPEDLAGDIPANDGPREIKVVPVYQEIERTLPSSFALYTANGLLCSGDGARAKRYNAKTKQKDIIPCSDECADKKSDRCKPSGTFYVCLPDYDIMSAYTIKTRSEQSLCNLYSCLNKLRDPKNPNQIKRAICTLRIVEKKKSEGNKTYNVLEMDPPVVTYDELKKVMGDTPAIEYTPDTPEANTDDEERIINGRSMVKDKARSLVNRPDIENTLEIFACKTFCKANYDDLKLSELQKLWKLLDEEKTIIEIRSL